MNAKRAMLALGILALIAGCSATPNLVGAVREENTYGPTPGIGIGELIGPEARTSCVDITSIRPPAHHDWLGRVWQDEYLMWDDIDIVERWNGTWSHGMSGPMKVGDEICDVPKYHVWVYTPEDKIFLTMG